MLSNRLLFFFLFLSLIFSTSIHSQNLSDYQFRLSHPIKFGDENLNSVPRFTGSQADSVKVVAILVQFQEDNTPFTTGNGQFDLSNKYFDPALQRDTVIDSPPYDSAYFADHLKFLKNYWEKSSKGKLQISYDLYGQVITLPKRMEEYSPRDNEPDFRRLGDLFTDAWTMASQFIDFTQYDQNKTAFVIFHAGTGRDVDLKSVLGFDPTPFDIPSVYLGLRNLQRFYGANYNGFETGTGFFIQNSMIVPSTELRELDLISGKFLIRLGMNGILTATFGSYLGLPDLFNTATGRSAIGRFGLMDGQAIFSYNGIFPPEPSAWEKVFLGFKEPITISSGNQLLRINESSSGVHTDSTLFKVLISSQEYFLIENRNRDPYYQGMRIYTRNRAFNDSTLYTQDVTGFESFDIRRVHGNVTDVSNLDWSLPGLINDTANYRGGILIWHIDETVINSNFATNTINNNIKRRGVSLKEAKGAQTIGVTFSTPFGDITGDGTIYDYWYNGFHGVPETIYKNEFTPNSIPNSLSYTLANNQIFITEFDTISPVMRVRIRIGSDQITPLPTYPKFVELDTSGNSQAIGLNFIQGLTEQLFVNSNNNIYGFKIDGSPVAQNEVVIPNAGKFIPSVLESKGGQSRIIIGTNGSELKTYNTDGNITSVNLTSGIVSAPPLVWQGVNSLFYLGYNSGVINRYTFDLTESREDSISGAVKFFSRTLSEPFVVINDEFKSLVTGNIVAVNSFDTLKVDLTNRLILNGKVLPLSYNLSVINTDPILADINKDGRQEILFVADSTLYAINSAGVVIDNFPVNFNRKVSSGLSVADINNDGILDVLFITSDGNFYVYGVNGKIVDGFPIQVGTNSSSTPAIFNADGFYGFAIAGGDGYLYAFKTSFAYNPNNVLWKNFLRDETLSNNNPFGNQQPPTFTSKLPEDKVYNWPNPVYDNTTFIRYYLNGNATSVTIKILDLSGELVTELTGTANSNAENEVVWNVGTVQSGIYYGVVEANIDGSTETRIIKIAIVK